MDTHTTPQNNSDYQDVNRDYFQTNNDYQNRGDDTKEIYTHKLKGERRTYFIDLKESQNGKFVKISEKSNGMKRTILLDQQDFAEFYQAFTEINTILNQ